MNQLQRIFTGLIVVILLMTFSLVLRGKDVAMQVSMGEMFQMGVNTCRP